MVVSGAVVGGHAVQFYEGEGFLHRSVAAFFADAIGHDEPALMISRRRTFDAVADRVAAAHGVSSTAAAARLQFVDVDDALGQMMDGPSPDRARVERSFADLITDLRPRDASGTIWIYGEMVDALCKDGNHAAAITLEELWNHVSSGERCSVLCGYEIAGFDADLHATQFRAVCRQHTHVIPTESFTDAPDDRTKCEQVALLQQRVRALDAALAVEVAGRRSGATTPTIFVVDDDESVRRSLARLLTSADMRAETFSSAEAFLAGVDRTARGCLILDVQLVGMDGAELQRLMARANWTIPVIAMSGSHDPQIEAQALELGAGAFLRKPFDAEELIDAIARALT
jgi:CheY-like chemotaxis protein